MKMKKEVQVQPDVISYICLFTFSLFLAPHHNWQFMLLFIESTHFPSSCCYCCCVLKKEEISGQKRTRAFGEVAIAIKSLYFSSTIILFHE